MGGGGREEITQPANARPELQGVQGAGPRSAALPGDAGGWNPAPGAPSPALLASRRGRAPYLGCSQAGSAMGVTGRRRQALQHRQGRSARPGGAARRPKPGPERRGLATLSNLQKKKKKHQTLRSCFGPEMKVKFLKFPQWLERAVPRVPGGGAARARAWAGLAAAGAHPRGSRSACQALLIFGWTLRCSCVEINGASPPNAKGCTGPRWAPASLITLTCESPSAVGTLSLTPSFQPRGLMAPGRGILAL